MLCCFRPHKVYIFLIRITSRVVLTMSVCLSVRMNAEIRKDLKLLGFGMQIPELPAQRKFVSAGATSTCSASLFQQSATPTLTSQTAQNCGLWPKRSSNRPKL